MNYWQAKAHELEATQAAIVAELYRTNDPDNPEPDEPTIIASPAGSEQALRGIPVITKGIPGTQPGTNPLRALLSRHRHTRRVA